MLKLNHPPQKKRNRKNCKIFLIIPVSKNTAPKTSSVTLMYIEQIANVTEIQGVCFYVGFLDPD